MNGLYHFGEPARTQSMRETTANQASMAGVTAGCFLCRCCGKRKNVSGRKQLVKGTNKFGYKCADCVASN